MQGETPNFKPKIALEEVKEQLANDKKKAAAKVEKLAPKTPEKQKKEPKQKKVPPKKKEAKAVEFPLSARINDYGWLGFRRSWLEALDWKLGENLQIDKNRDGSVTIRKKEA